MMNMSLYAKDLGDFESPAPGDSAAFKIQERRARGQRAAVYVVEARRLVFQSNTRLKYA